MYPSTGKYQCQHHLRGVDHCGDCLAGYHAEQARVISLQKTPVTQGGKLAATLAEVADALPDYFFAERGMDRNVGLTEVDGKVHVVHHHLPYGDRPEIYTTGALSYSLA
jgi:hypothetical protein